MKIEKDRAVSIHYVLTDDQGKELEHSDPEVPMAYLHGHGNLLPALEKQLEGKQAGDAIEVQLAPAEAYGEAQPNSVQRISKKHFKDAGKLEVGKVLTAQTEEGPRMLTIKKVGHSMIDVDTNHPYAGKHLNFRITVASVRPALKEELDHGHVHGPGGHEHRE